MGRKNLKAFTLVELIIVVSILAFIALIAIAYFRGQLFKGNDARRKSDINRIQIALEEYEKDHNCYPLPQFVSCKPGTGLRPYIDIVPCDPATKSSYYYQYDDSVCPKWYRLYSFLDNKNDSQITEGIGPSGAFNFYQESPNAPDVNETSTSPDGIPFYGCKGGVCVSIPWDNSRPGPKCDPNYQSSNCYNQCGPIATECVSWK